MKAKHRTNPDIWVRNMRYLRDTLSEEDYQLAVLNRMRLITNTRLSRIVHIERTIMFSIYLVAIISLGLFITAVQIFEDLFLSTVIASSLCALFLYFGAPWVAAQKQVVSTSVAEICIAAETYQVKISEVIDLEALIDDGKLCTIWDSKLSAYLAYLPSPTLDEYYTDGE